MEEGNSHLRTCRRKVAQNRRGFQRSMSSKALRLSGLSCDGKRNVTGAWHERAKPVYGGGERCTRGGGVLVTIFVPDDHPLLQLKEVRGWEVLRVVMVKQWRAAGKNVDARPGQVWPVAW
jgi:hypothetical protein